MKQSTRRSRASDIARRDFIRLSGAMLASAALPPVWSAAEHSGAGVLQLEPGPQLFVDDFLVEESSGIARVVHPPAKMSRPVLDNARFGTTQPYGSAARDENTGGYRFWYNRGSAIWEAESRDAVEWANPRVAWDLPRAYGCSLIDDREREADPARRFKLANWRSTREFDDTPKDDSGMCVGFSADGSHWTNYAGNPVLKTWPEGYGKVTGDGVGDIIDVYYDVQRQRYAAAVKVHSLREEGMTLGRHAGTFTRRLVGMTYSEDFMHWTKPSRILVPDSRDEGVLEFYGMGGMHVRGGLRIGLVRILRDDLAAEAGGQVDGIGYTVLATSRDGERWVRDREPFIDRNPEPGTWDRAMAWVSTVQPVGSELFVYYGGYARGHKIAPDSERQIGLARMPRDRYVSRCAGDGEGRIRTPLFRTSARQLTVNANVKGQLRVRVLDGQGRAIAGLGESRPVSGDSLEHPVMWEKPLASIANRNVRFEFILTSGDLFAFDLA